LLRLPFPAGTKSGRKAPPIRKVVRYGPQEDTMGSENLQHLIPKNPAIFGADCQASTTINASCEPGGAHVRP